MLHYNRRKIGNMLLAGAVLLLFLTGCQSYQFHGNAINPPEALPDFRLTDTAGQTRAVSDLKGRVVLLYFGYTHCPDACPLTLAHFAQVKRDLGTDAGQVAFVFVTTDPDRDTADVLKQYLAQFDPGIIGLRGTQDELSTIYQGYHVAAMKQEANAGQSEYTITHSDVIYVLDKSGKWRDIFDSNSNVGDVVNDVRYLVHE